MDDTYGGGEVNRMVVDLRARIEQLERELAERKKSSIYMDAQHQECRDQLAAEKALADRLIVAGANALQGDILMDRALADEWNSACADYRKARGV